MKCKILENFLRVKTLQNENEVKMILQISVSMLAATLTIVEVRVYISCNICGRGFTTNIGLLLRLNVYQRKQQQQQNQQANQQKNLSI